MLSVSGLKGILAEHETKDKKKPIEFSIGFQVP